jgi:hypothetical protein
MRKGKLKKWGKGRKERAGRRGDNCPSLVLFFHNAGIIFPIKVTRKNCRRRLRETMCQPQIFKNFKWILVIIW